MNNKKHIEMIFFKAKQDELIAEKGQRTLMKVSNDDGLSIAIIDPNQMMTFVMNHAEAELFAKQILTDIALAKRTAKTAGEE